MECELPLDVEKEPARKQWGPQSYSCMVLNSENNINEARNAISSRVSRKKSNPLGHLDSALSDSKQGNKLSHSTPGFLVYSTVR